MLMVHNWTQILAYIHQKCDISF